MADAPRDLRSETESVEALVGREVAEPVVATEWTQEEARRRKAAPLRIYLGAAPGVGKTYAMLSEGHRRLDRGTDVVVGFVATYGRPQTVAMLEGLEIVPVKVLRYRERAFEEMDVDALLERAPAIALVDELAHTNIPGSRHGTRWEDAMEALAAGIEVITTVNIQHLESLNDVIANVTGIRQQETIPDWLFDLADQVELVDMSPHALRRRMAHGNVYPDPRKAELALQRFFTMENLTALREMALLKVANQVDDSLLERWTREGAAPDVRERVLVLVSRRGEISDSLIRRGARLAQRARGELLVLHVRQGEGATDPEWLAEVEALTKDLGGAFDVIDSETPVDAVIGYAYRHSVTQIVVGESLRSRWKELMQGSFVTRLIRAASNLDIHVISRRGR
ncbi:MAG TPA: sensor histidine kinase KdpD [Actinomycetota bacterium]|nr:sensor histidine kinase KdpD [Actinomycetota bacterium]